MTLLNFRLLAQHPDCWVTMATLRASKAHEARCGLTTCAPYLLRAWRADLEAGGVLRLGAGDVRLARLRIAAVCADEAALAGLFGLRGAAGRKPCWLCRNLVARRAEQVGVDRPGLVQAIIRAPGSPCFWFSLSALQEDAGIRWRTRRWSPLSATWTPRSGVL